MYMRKGPKGYFRNDSAGFTSLELLACITACAILLAVITPILTTTRSRSDRAACMSNLRQIGTAFRQFGLEHNDIMPWRPQTIDSNFSQPGKHELWFQYWWLRDSIGTPKILMDPAETRPSARIATDWTLDVNGGLQFFKNSGVAYVLGLDSSTDLPRSMLVADRNILLGGYGGCSSQLSTAARVFVSGTSAARWLDDVHGTFGNVALADGSVESVDSEGLRRIIAESRDVGDAVHIMVGNNW
jgi:prepilin-type processing-associated H-X9-DG protein